MNTQPSRRQSVTVRKLISLEDFYHFQEVQQRIWVGAPEDVVPIHVLVTQAKNGGLVQGAFVDDGPVATGGMIGIAFGWPGFGPATDGAPRLKFCSHIVGVLPEWHGRGVGLALKLAQRDALLEQGLMDWATWTYDPLQRVNAIFNIHRLGATCNTYLRNVYGPMQDALNAGMPTDRFQVDWHLKSERVHYALSPGRRPVDWSSLAMEIAPTQAVNDEGRLRGPVSDFEPSLDGRPFAVPIPESVPALRAESLDLLLAWRFYQRGLLEKAFDAGYVVVDCLVFPRGGAHYILIPAGLHPFPGSPWP